MDDLMKEVLCHVEERPNSNPNAITRASGSLQSSGFQYSPFGATIVPSMRSNYLNTIPDSCTLIVVIEIN